MGAARPRRAAGVAGLVGLVLLYLLRFVLAPPSTGAGLRQVVIAAAPLPAAPPRRCSRPEEVPAIEPPPVTEPPELEGASKRARLAWWYERDADYGNRAAGRRRRLKRLAPLVDLAEGTARGSTRRRICEDLEKDGPS